MRKKVLVFAVAVLMIFALCGCGAATQGVFGGLIGGEAQEPKEEEPIQENEPEEKEPEVQAPTTLDLTVMSYNMRYLNTNSFQDNWYNRRASVIKRVNSYSPDLLGTQELTPTQKKWVVEQLGDTYSCVGIARDTTGETQKGEGSYIFFKTEKFELLESGTKWLSETPDVCSLGWDAACRRVVTFVKLKDKASGIEFKYFNTHLDHIGDDAILNGNNYILSLIEKETCPVIYTGDLNHNEKHQNYKNTTAILKDSKYAAEVSTGGASYIAYEEYYLENPEKGLPIDHCFVSNSIDVHSYKVDNRLVDNMFGSDHFPIVITMTLGNQK